MPAAPCYSIADATGGAAAAAAGQAQEHSTIVPVLGSLGGLPNTRLSVNSSGFFFISKWQLRLELVGA